MTRHFGEATYNGFKTAWKQLIQALGGLDAAAACLRVGRTSLSNYGLLGMEDRHAPIDLVADAEAIAGTPFVTTALAAAQGYTLVPIVSREAGDLSAALVNVGRESTNLLADFAGAVADSHISDNELSRLISDADTLLRVVSEARAVMVARRSDATREQRLVPRA